MITVTGATGALNGATVEHLLRTVPAGDLVVVARDVTAARRFADRGVTVRHGDYSDPGSLPAALEGTGQLLMVSSNDRTGRTLDQHRAVVEAAAAAGVERILYTSHQGASARNPFAPARTHAATEELLAASGVPWTALRNGFYRHSAWDVLGPWRATGRFAVPLDGPVSWTAREDSAQAAAALLTSGAVPGGLLTLTASAAPTFTELAALASAAVGREVVCEVVGPREWLARQVAAGVPEPLAQFTLGLFQGAHEGFFAGTGPAMGELLGREPSTVQDDLAAQARAA